VDQTDGWLVGMSTIGPGNPYYVEPYEDPYPTPEPTPYQPEDADISEQGPLDSSPPGSPLLTPEEAIANQAAEVAAVVQSLPDPEPTEPPMVTAYKATLPS
jgi:hypothetical protein